MRLTLLCLMTLMAACASERQLAGSPPSGVDLSGRWQLNVADSDDPMRLSQALAAGAGLGPTSDADGGQRGGRGGRGGRGDGGGRGGGSAGAPPGGPGAFGPAVLPASTLAEVLRWPGASLEIKQVGGVAAFSSDGDSRVYQPTDAPKPAAVKGRRNNDAPAICGWQGAALVVDVEADGEGPPMEEHYKLSGDGRRLVQLVVIKGGRMSGFAMSRVWDRVP